MNESKQIIPPLPERNQWCRKYPWEKLLTHGYFEYPIGDEGHKVAVNRILNAAISKGLKVTVRANKKTGIIGVWRKDAA
jgi:hypothetical protein